MRRVVALPACGCSPSHLWLQAEHGNVEEADKLFSSFAAQQRLKQCPRCKFFVEKTSGCDAMRTPTCAFATPRLADEQPRPAAHALGRPSGQTAGATWCSATNVAVC